ncbi:MAG: hypothetical protein LBL91_05950 [Lachnospiraceae bacterium]|jgi:transcriptional regulator with XRE-family HTH domain|nr:hypothetical protein [Lachnospiraceae bacterium]
MEKTKPKTKKNTVFRYYLFHQRKKVLKLTINDICTRLEINESYYYDLEAGRSGHRMDILFMEDLANALETTLDFIISSEKAYQQERLKFGLRKRRRWSMFDEPKR